MAKTNAQRAKEWRDRHPGYHSRISKERRLRNKQRLIEALGHSCALCGCDPDNIEIDHIDPSRKKSGRSVWCISWKHCLEEMDNLRILCYTCHRKVSKAQQIAAWELFTSLTVEEQITLTNKHLS